MKWKWKMNKYIFIIEIENWKSIMFYILYNAIPTTIISTIISTLISAIIYTITSTIIVNRQ